MGNAAAHVDEAELICRCLRGDLNAFDTLINTHAAKIYNLAYRMLGSQQDAEDAAQEAFIRAYSGLKNFRRGSSFSTWIYRIATNVCLDELKRRRSRPQPVSSLMSTDEDADPISTLEENLSTSPADDPGERMTQQATQQEVEQALAALPEHQRIVVVMCDIEELSYEEAAEALETNVGTIKSRLHRARLRLRELLAPRRELLMEK